jgi:uncharacterized protein YqeY
MDIETLRKDMRVALVEKDKVRLNVIKEIIAEAVNLSIAAKSSKDDEINDKYVNDALIKVRKVCKEQIETCPESRKYNLEEFKTRLSIVESYLPKQLSEEEVRSKISELVAGKEIKNVGEIMKIIMPELKGKADGKLINNIAREFISK